ncbi:hypothetical protein CC85DRAFT_310365 [Cutaneotrichosporon oleaginosum]|uniref:TPR-like protein n=1 Tax=Cutaneotrichosporon oleaginosum TaxID=879819 RepID=A0A0J0XYB1_9TREE|nr:uncharacterized protein CC85DRAFT_310365 [Cutaneotrichosporon oleaginosum]KLT46042.1 hypothetical protein CC85DRAFT_310365 [Cutaneotrichosporon oleaginosum]TXT06736.1 hypothetical protein COLE_06067 [Cutaneotrichosporon oleaginosum]
MLRLPRLVPAARPLSRPLARPLVRPLARSLSTRAPSPRPPPASQGGLRVSHLFLALAGGAILITTYGILEWYSSLRVWPASIREPLKKALKARNHGETDKAEKYFLSALAAAHALPPAALAPEPLHKMAGLYATFAAMLEGYNPIRAYVVLRDARALFGDLVPGSVAPYTGEGMGEGDVVRAIGLAQKMGQIAARMGGAAAPPPFPTGSMGTEGGGGEGGDGGEEGAAAALLRSAGGEVLTGAEAGKAWDEAAEAHLSAAIAAMLKMGLAHRPTQEGEGGEPVVVGRDVRLPHDGEDAGRVNRRGLGMTMETLAEVYGRRGRPDLAGQLVLQAITTLLPPQAEPGSVPPADRCQAAMLMTSLSSYALGPRTQPAIAASRSWSLRALQEAEAATKAAGWGTGLPTDMGQAVCQRAGSVALFNLGMLAEMEGDERGARKYFNAALAAARDSGFAEGRREAAEALRRVRAKSEAKDQEK